MATACFGSKMCSTANGLWQLLRALSSLNKAKMKFSSISQVCQVRGTSRCSVSKMQALKASCWGPCQPAWWRGQCREAVGEQLGSSMELTLPGSVGAGCVLDGRSSDPLFCYGPPHDLRLSQQPSACRTTLTKVHQRMANMP